MGNCFTSLKESLEVALGVLENEISDFDLEVIKAKKGD
jgi:hypothetical protein